MSTKLNLKDYILAGYPAIVYRTSEERRALSECLSFVETNNYLARKEGRFDDVYEFLCWSETNEFHDPKSEVPNNKTVDLKYNSIEHPEVLVRGLNEGKGKPLIFCVLDFHHYINNPVTMRAAKDCFRHAKDRSVTYIFISDSFEIPSELKHEMLVYDMELPTKEDFEKLIHSTLEMNGNTNNVTEDDIARNANALCGLTLQEAENALAVSLLKTEKLSLDIIYGIKTKTICQDNLLEFYHSNESMDNVGGMEEFKEYARERSFAGFSDDAQAYGLPYPKGVLLFGVPGCGKSLAAKALANMWQAPLLKLDLSKLFASLVGETESNTRKALQMAESMAPCVLWLDEVEKAIAGTQSSGVTDSGVTSRMFGSILTWLQEKRSAVYVIATANGINLPPEFLRKGRFDEIFFVDLPNPEEREQIWKIQIKKHLRAPENYNIDELVKLSDEYNGAEIEECIVSAMYHAWNDGKRDYTTEDIKVAISKLTPASQGVAKEAINHLKQWSKDRGIRNASKPMKANYLEKENSVGSVSHSGRIRRSSDL